MRVVRPFLLPARFADRPTAEYYTSKSTNTPNPAVRVNLIFL